MSKTFFTSDLHFNHDNILKYTSRPWSTVSEMNEALIENWNNTVSAGDTVYVIGDFAMGDRSKVPDFLSRLNGEITLIYGNHDPKKTLEHFKNWVDRLVLRMYDDVYVELVHNPSHATCEYQYVFCGHVHEAWSVKDVGETIPGDFTRDHSQKYDSFPAKTKFINVGVDVNEYTPKTFEELIKKVNQV